MSEFSESYHLRTNDKKEGVNLLKTIGVNGIVFEATNEWVTVLPEAEMYSLLEPMSSYQGTILHYMYAQDHAWTTKLFTNGELISGFFCSWDPEFQIDNSSLKIDALAKYLSSPNLLPQLEELFTLNDLDSVLRANPAYTFASLMGLKHYEWLAGQDIPTHGEDILKSNSGAEYIKA